MDAEFVTEAFEFLDDLLRLHPRLTYSSPQEAAAMNRARFARIAKDTASDRLLAAVEAGTISRAEARAKLDKLHAAYRKRVSDIEYADWLAARGLTNIVRIAA